MVSDMAIHNLVGEARQGSDAALERLVRMFLEAEDIRTWARKKAAELSDQALQPDELLSFVQDAVWHAACDEQGTVRWDEARGAPFSAWVFKLVHDKHVCRAVRRGAAQKRTPRPDAAYYGIEWFTRSHGGAVDARLEIELYVSELQRAGKTDCARVLELLATGASFSDVAFEMYGERTPNRRRAVGRRFAEVRSFCDRRFRSGKAVSCLRDSGRHEHRDHQVVVGVAG
jgi:hypothetical protein